MPRSAQLREPSRMLHEVVMRCPEADLPRTLADFCGLLAELTSKRQLMSRVNHQVRGGFWEWS
jgi:hypothetical protein